MIRQARRWTNGCKNMLNEWVALFKSPISISNSDIRSRKRIESFFDDDENCPVKVKIKWIPSGRQFKFEAVRQIATQNAQVQGPVSRGNGGEREIKASGRSENLSQRGSP